ncbi:MAG: mechanosensitive ion channel family protein [Bifidobacteriaceae bacterium]|jgi:small conductance mechanosensitive channel|nr:mechanosensitive ion channel family protein [Bifidobacteriaceae bacterium]
MLIANPPEFAKDWPEWARLLMGAPLRIVVVLVAALIAAAVARGLIRRAAERMARRPVRDLPAAGAEQAALRRAARFKTLGSVLSSVAGWVIWILAACLVLEALGVNVGLIITSLGVAGMAVGLGAQNLVKDMVAGLFMLVEGQYGLGDVVDTGAATGTIEAMSLRITTLKDADGTIWYVPNGTITRIGNKGPTAQ